ncbi:17-beta-hydroxysteroid dehydrogenase type 6-like [Ornithodoros turicata]|uniref:17-beta-hydroxysteroid dehydrogenase type 6-like n=1 Tax=Ornithodoros turicata TaxID=34597 RepID=UPI0031393BF6
MKKATSKSSISSDLWKDVADLKKAVKTSEKRVVFITGCDTGFGHELVKRLDSEGFQVIAGCLNVSCEGATMLREFCSPSLRILRLDVTREDHIRQAAKSIQDELGSRPLWAVVANAGLMSAGELEWGSTECVRHLFDVNVFGVVNVVKMALPMLRRAPTSDDAQPRVVIVASVAGRVTYPGLAYYSMSKHAAISFADGLRREMRKWRIKVCTIEPVLYKTRMSQADYIQYTLDQSWQGAPETTREAYGKAYFETFRDRCLEFLERRSRCDVHEVVDCMVNAVTAIRPKPKYFCGGPGDRFRYFLLRKVLSTRAVDRLLCSINQGVIRQKSVSDDDEPEAH